MPGLWKSECRSGICSSPTILALPCDCLQMGEGLGWTWAILGFCISTRETSQFRERRNFKEDELLPVATGSLCWRYCSGWEFGPCDVSGARILIARHCNTYYVADSVHLYLLIGSSQRPCNIDILIILSLQLEN